MKYGDLVLNSSLLNLWFTSVQLFSHVRLFVTPWTAACQASLSINNSQSLLKLMIIELRIPSNHRILCHPLLLCLISFPESRSFQMSEFLSSGGQSTGVTGSTSVLSMNIQDWFPFGWTGWISLQSKELSRVFSDTTQFQSISSSALRLLHTPTLTSIHDHRKNYSLD